VHDPSKELHRETDAEADKERENRDRGTHRENAGSEWGCRSLVAELGMEMENKLLLAGMLQQ
jgi:hypothetical protein